MPPSTNNLFFNAHSGRVRSRAYNDWSMAAGLTINAAHPGTMPGPVQITILLEDKHPRRDCDNALKPLIDLLTPHKNGLGIIDGDHAKVLRKLTVEWADVTGAVITIERAA
jgi:hypothetical protein